jgi:hypothetical protein
LRAMEAELFEQPGREKLKTSLYEKTEAVF